MIHLPEFDSQLDRVGLERRRYMDIDTHAADSGTGRHVLQVDGMPMEVSCAVVTMPGRIARNGLVENFKRAF
jgi:hypothetical protein